LYSILGKSVGRFLQLMLLLLPLLLLPLLLLLQVV
jgi:hypothetical protein